LDLETLLPTILKRYRYLNKIGKILGYDREYLQKYNLEILLNCSGNTDNDIK
jgi:hypothetical protein